MAEIIGYIVGAFKAVGAAAAGTGTATIWQQITVFAVTTAAKLAVSYGVQKALGKSYDAAGALRGRTQNVRNTVMPHQYVYGICRVGGQVAFMGTSGVDNEYFHVALVHAAHECAALGDVYLDGELVGFSGEAATGKYAGYLSKWDHLGADDQAADAVLMAAFAGWTAAHRLRGCCYTHFRLKYDPEGKVFPGGIPTFNRVVSGKLVYDPRTDATGWSDNWALCVADYVKTVYGKANADFDASAWVAAANVSDELVQLSDTNFENRYTVNGTVTADEDPRSVLANLRNAGAGFAEEIGGLWVIHAGAWRTPDMTLTESDFITGLTVDTKASIHEGGNRVKGVFANAADRWTPMEFPSVENATYLAEDNGIERWLDMDYRFTTSGATAQRLAKLSLERARQGILVRGAATVSALKVRAGDVVQLDFAKWGFVGKTFEVERLQFMEIAGDTGPALGVELTLRETASGIYDWANGEETEIDLAPNTTLPDPWTVGAASWGLLESGTDHLVGKSDGTIISRIWAPWTAASDAFIERYELQYATSAQAALGNWTSLPDMPRSSSGVYVADVSDGAAYKLRIRAVNALGVKGAWVESAAHTVIGKSAAPSDPSGLAAAALVEGVKFSWSEVTDIDLKDYVVYVGLLSGAPPSTPYGYFSGTELVISNLTAGTAVYLWLKSRDTTGNTSALVGPVTATPDERTVAIGEGALSANVKGYRFQARADGVLTESVDNGDSLVEVFLGSSAKAYDAGGGLDTWTFGTITATNCTRDAGVAAPSVGISALSADSGYLTVPIVYTTSGGDTRNITAKVLYDKSRAGSDMAASGFAISLPASAAGVVASFAPAAWTPYVTWGGAAKTYAAAPTNDRWRYGTITETDCTRDVGLTAPEIGISAMSADAARLTATVIYRDDQGVDHGAQAIGTFGKGYTGAVGATGATSAAVTIYKRSASTPALPTATATYTFATGAISGLNNGWTAAVPATDGNPLYVSQATALGSGSTDAIGAGEWAAAVKLVEDGATGAAGLNSATVTLYQRTASATPPAVPGSTLTYTFATGGLSGTLGSWSQSLPTTGGEYRYVTTAAAISSGATDAITSGEWASPALLSADGVDGTNGTRIANGLVYLTAPQAATPATPSASAFNFSTGAFTGLTAGWQVVPVEVVMNDSTTKYWQSRYNVSEATLGGAQTLTFATPTGSINFGDDIQSDNFVAGSSGWRLERDTGDLEANNGTFRGDLFILGPADEAHFEFDQGVEDGRIRGYDNSGNQNLSLSTGEFGYGIPYLLLQKTSLSTQASLGGEGSLYLKSNPAWSDPLKIDGGTSNFSLKVDKDTGHLEFGSGGASFDTNLYRSGVNSLKTDDNFQVGGSLQIGADTNLYRSAANVLATDDDLRVIGGNVFLGADCELYRASANMLRTPDSLTVDGGLTVGGAVAGGHLDTSRAALIQATEGRLQIMASNSGSAGAALTLSNESKHWMINNTPSDNRLEFRYGATTADSDVFPNTSTVVEFAPDGTIYVNGSPIGGDPLTTQPAPSDLTTSALTSAGVIGNAPSISSVSTAIEQIKSHIDNTIKDALVAAGVLE